MNFQILKTALLENNMVDFKKDICVNGPLTDAEAHELSELAYSNPEAKQDCYRLLSMVTILPDYRLYRSDAEFVYRGCCDTPENAALYGLTLGPRNMPTASIFEHKRTTQSSLYLSCTKSFEIAKEFAESTRFKTRLPTYIYKIRTHGGIDCKKWFYPKAEFHEDESEVLFANHISPELVVSYATVNRPEEFLPLPMVS